MFNKTQCAIRPFAASGNPISGEVMAKLMTNWSFLASAVEEKVSLKENEVIMWALYLSGGNGKDEPARAYAEPELCKETNMSTGAMHLLGNGLRPTALTRIGFDSLNILEEQIIRKEGRIQNFEEAAKEIAARLRKER